MKKWMTTWATAATVTGLAAATALYAQNRQEQGETFRPDQEQSESRRDARERGDREEAAESDRDRDRRDDRDARGDRRSRQDDSRSTSQLKLKPTGWIRIAYDTDGDGRYDAFETLYGFDLINARRSSRDRQTQELHGQQRQAGYRGADSIRGQVRELHTQQLAGFDDPHLMARIQTKDGRTAKVDLGPKSRLNAIDISEGDELTVSGVRGRVNDRTMLMATRIETGDRSIEIERPRATRQKRVRGTIESLHTRTFRGRDAEFSVASVRLPNGRTEQVVLGEKSELRRLDLEEGDDIAARVCSCRVNGRPALKALEVFANGEAVELQASQRSRSSSDSRAEEPQRATASRAGEFSGRIFSMRTTRFRGLDQDHVLAQILLDGGERKTVNLGPESYVARLRLGTGQSIDFTARHGKINGDAALIAESISADDNRINIPRPESRQKFNRDKSRDDR